MCFYASGARAQQGIRYSVFVCVYVSVCVRVCLSVCLSVPVCVGCYSCSMINEGVSSHVFLDCNLYSFAIIIMLRSRVIARFAYLERLFSLFRTASAYSKTCPWSVAILLYST